MSVIEAGYRITVHSWENDGDSNQIAIVNGLSFDDAKLLVDACMLCGQDRFGNMYQPEDERIDEFQAALREVIVKHDHEGKLDKDDLANAVDVTFDNMSDMNLSCGEYYTRVCEKIIVEYIPVEITIQDVTSEFIS